VILISARYLEKKGETDVSCGWGVESRGDDFEMWALWLQAPGTLGTPPPPPSQI
jgi:hypothetical protein